MSEMDKCAMEIREALVRMEERQKDDSEKLDKLVETVYGNGREGMVVRLDRIEQREETRKWFRRLAGGAIIAGLIGTIL